MKIDSELWVGGGGDQVKALKKVSTDAQGCFKFKVKTKR